MKPSEHACNPSGKNLNPLTLNPSGSTQAQTPTPKNARCWLDSATVGRKAHRSATGPCILGCLVRSTLAAPHFLELVRFHFSASWAYHRSKRHARLMADRRFFVESLLNPCISWKHDFPSHSLILPLQVLAEIARPIPLSSILTPTSQDFLGILYPCCRIAALEKLARACLSQHSAPMNLPSPIERQTPSKKARGTEAGVVRATKGFGLCGAGLLHSTFCVSHVSLLYRVQYSRSRLRVRLELEAIAWEGQRSALACRRYARFGGRPLALPFCMEVIMRTLQKILMFASWEGVSFSCDRFMQASQRLTGLGAAARGCGRFLSPSSHLKSQCTVST